MSRSKKVRNERGIALITVLLVALAVSGIALAAAMWTLNATLITKSGDRTATLNDIALAGLEEGRSQLNANPAVYPSTGYATLAAAAPVTDVLGNTVPNVRRPFTWGPTELPAANMAFTAPSSARCATPSVTRWCAGSRSIRRALPSSPISPTPKATSSSPTTTRSGVRSTRTIRSRFPSTGATFFDQVTTAASSIQGENNATFMGPAPKKNVAPIAMPTTAAFPALQGRAAAAGMSFVSNLNGNSAG